MRTEIGIDELQAECTTLERAVRSASLATVESLGPHRPGGEQNAATDVRGWLRFYAVLHRIHAKQEYSTAEANRERADAIALDALRAEPIRVSLIEEDKSIFVYPKSLDALLHVHALDRQLAWMLEQKRLLETEGSAASIDLLTPVADAIAYTYNLLCWIVTTEGPEMPYDALEARPEIPERVLTLDPWDLIRICQAHQEHLTRLSVLSALIDNKTQNEKGQRPSWSMFIGAMSVDLGTSAVSLMKHRSLAELLAVARLNVAAKTPPESDDAAA